ncbi:RNA polymerase sigma factor [Streptomyces sp. CT34]|uniref:RNA polymerase sigma factor n=1 Tax=Streptomyces sp. CT34 TaxID=1553907 RepID=UPI00099C85F9|nr:RNA polymerase sigma factor [Streptomyces sp. CT34]
MASPTFDEVFCGLLPRLYRRAVMLAGTRQSAEDVVHEAYLKLAARPHRLLTHPEPYAYAFTAVLNVARDAHRKDRRQVLVDRMERLEEAGPGAATGYGTGAGGAVSGAGDAAGAGGAGWDGGVERRHAELEAVRLLGRLSHRQAGIVILVDLDGYTIDQAAKIMKVHRGTAARHRARALDRLRGYLEEPQLQPQEPSQHGGPGSGTGRGGGGA